MDLDPKYWVTLGLVVLLILAGIALVNVYIGSGWAFASSILFAISFRWIVNGVGRLVYGSDEWVRI